MAKVVPLKLESRFVAIEGPVGVGKTSLAQRLADHVGGKLILEEPENNPFLENFYLDPKSNALPTELSFLFQRAKQMESINQEDLFSDISIADFLFEKDSIFSELNLKPINFDGFETHAPILSSLSKIDKVSISVLFIKSKVSKFKVCGSKSLIILDKSL